MATLPDPFSLISEEEKEKLQQDLLNINNVTNLPEEEDEQRSFVERIVNSPLGTARFGASPLSIKGIYDVASALPKAASVSAQTVVPEFKQRLNDQERRIRDKKFMMQTGIDPLSNEKVENRFRPPPIGFGEGAASRLLLTRELEAIEKAENEFDNLAPSEKRAIVDDYRDFLVKNSATYNALQDQIDAVNQQAKLNKTERALSAGFNSLALMTPAILATLATRNPQFMYGMLPVFGAYEQGASYREAIMSGLSHQEAARVSNINALSEIGTELIPMPFVGKTLKKYWKDNGSSVQQFARDGFTTTLLELGGENLNTVIQETNKAFSGVNTELAIALRYKDDPTYTGPTVAQVMLDNAYMTSIATVVGAGGMVGMQGVAAFSPDIKRSINSLDPDLGRRLARELSITVNEVNSQYKSIDDTFTFLEIGKRFDPGAFSILQEQDIEGPKNRQYYDFVVPEILPDDFLASRIIQNSTLNEELSEEEIELANRLQQEVLDEDGPNLAELLEDGKKVINIMGIQNQINPQTFDQEIQARIEEMDVQIEANTNESTIKKIKADQKILRSYLAKKALTTRQDQRLDSLRYGKDTESRSIETGEFTDHSDIVIDKTRIRDQSDMAQLVRDELQKGVPAGLDPSVAEPPLQIPDFKVFREPNFQEVQSVNDNVLNPLRYKGKQTFTRVSSIDNFGVNFEENILRDDYMMSNPGGTAISTLRDFNEAESMRVAEVLNNAFALGMPKQVLQNLSFLGMHAHDASFFDAAYFPKYNYIGLKSHLFTDLDKPIVKDFLQQKGIESDAVRLGQKLDLHTILLHELGHHVDIGFGQYKMIVKRREGFSQTSKLFEPIDFVQEIQNVINKTGKSGLEELTTEDFANHKFTTGGSVMQEMFSAYIEAREGSDLLPFAGQLFSYPFDRYLINAIKGFPALATETVTRASDRGNIQTEVFAQMFALNYTNPKLFDKYPNSKKLLKDIENVFINNELSQIGIGLRDAFQADRSDADSKIYEQIPTRDNAPEVFAEQSTSERLADDARKQRLESRRSKPARSNYVDIGELKAKPDGTFAGAPKTKEGKVLNTAKDFDSLVQDLLTKAEQKELSLLDQSRHWYKNINQEIDALTQGDQQLKEDVLRMLTIYSSQTPVEANLAYTLRSLVALAKGKKPVPGFQPKSGEFAEAAMAAPEFGQRLPGVGFKLQSFYENLSAINPNAVTMDTWMFKLLGFGPDQNKIANHRYGKSVIQEVAQQYNKKNSDNLTPMEMQAVLWTWARNKKLQEQGKPAEYIGYENYLDAATAVVTGEVIPTKKVDEYAFAEKMTQQEKVNMTREMLDMLTTGKGKNKIMDLLGGTGLYKFSHSFGAYDGNINPNILTSLVLEKTSGSQEFDQNDLDFADEFLRAWGYIFTQDAMPYFVSNESITDEQALDVNDESVNLGSAVKFINKETGLPVEITSLLRQQIYDALRKEGIDGFTQVQKDTLSLINFKFEGSVIEDFDAKVERAMGAIEMDGVGFAVEHNLKYNTQYLTNDWTEQTYGQNYLQGRLEERNIQDGLIRLRAEAQKIINKYRESPREDTVNGTFPTNGRGSPDPEPLASRKETSQETKQKIESGLNKINQPPTPPGPPSTVDPDGKFTIPESTYWANYMEEFNIAVANKFGRVWTIEEAILTQFGQSEIARRLQDLGIDPDSKDWRISTQTDIMQGRVKDKFRDLREKFYEPLLQYLVDNNITEEQYNHFIYNLHAPERNKYLPSLFTEALQEAESKVLNLEADPEAPKNDLAVARRNVTILKKKIAKAEMGSGIRTEDAIATLKKYGVIFDEKTMTARGSFTKGKKLLEAFTKFHAPMIENTRKIYIDSGLIPEQTVRDWDARYKYYVPLKGFAEDTLIDPVSGREVKRVASSNNLINSQMTVTGTLEKQAKGRESIASAPLQQSVMQGTAAAIESEKNRVTRTLADLARAFPQDTLWSVSEDAGQIVAVDAKWDEATGKSRVGFKEDGVQKYVEIYDRKLARGFDNFDSNVTGLAMKSFRAVTRYLSMVNTSLDPAFMINNFLRDVQTGYFNLLAEQEIEGGRAKGLEIAEKYYTTKNILSNAISLARYEKYRSLNGGRIKKEIERLRSGFSTNPELMNTEITPEIIQQVKDKFKLTEEEARLELLLSKFKEFGAETGYIEQKTVEQLTEEFQNLADMYKGNFKGNRKKAINNIFGAIERANVAIENAARLTAFQGYVESMGGVENATPAIFERAAALSKNLTINFNRMGTWGPQANALYMFFNASIQGTVNVFRGLTPGNFSSRKAKVAAGLVGWGTAQTLYNILFSEEDEDGRLWYAKIPEWEKQTKYIIMFPEVAAGDGELVVEKWGSGSKYFTFTEDGRKLPVGLGVPMPYGYAIFANTGRIATELALAKVLDNYDRTIAEAGLDYAESFLHNYAPLSIALPRASDEQKVIKSIPSFVPSAARPFAELMVNRDFFGAPITYESFFIDDPNSYREKTGNFKFIEKITQAVNDATGGNEFYEGEVDWDPSVIQYLVDYAGGGTLRTFRRTANVLFSPEEQRPDQFPFKRRVTAGPRDAEDRRFYFENVGKLQKIESAYRKLSESDDPSEDPEDFLDRKDPTGNLRDLINTRTAQNTRKFGNTSELARVKKQLEELKQEKADLRSNYEESNPVYYEREKDRIEFEEVTLMKEFNKQYLEAIRN